MKYPHLIYYICIYKLQQNRNDIPLTFCPESDPLQNCLPTLTYKLKGTTCRKLSHVLLLNFIVLWVLTVCNDTGGPEERERERKRNTCETNSHDPWHTLFFVPVKCLFSLNSKTSSIFKDTALLLLLSDAILKKKRWFYCMALF